MLPGAVLGGQGEAHLQAGTNSKGRWETQEPKRLYPTASSLVPVASFELCRLTVCLG